MPPKRQYKKKTATKSKVPRKYVAKKQSEQSVVKIVNKVLRKKTEVKHKDQASVITTLNHNNYLVNSYIKTLIGGPSSGTGLVIGQGTLENEMVGNEVNIIGTMLKIQFELVNDRLNTKCRVLIVRVPIGYDVTSAYTQVFDPLTNNVLLDMVDRRRVTVLYDKIIGYKNFNPTNGTDRICIFKNIIVPRQKYKMNYVDDASSISNQPKFKDVLIILAYDAIASLLTDQVANVQVFQRTYFTDM